VIPGKKIATTHCVTTQTSAVPLGRSNLRSKNVALLDSLIKVAVMSLMFILLIQADIQLFSKLLNVT